MSLKFDIQVFSCLCSLKVFTIKGKEADYDDFGEKYDRDPGNAEDYACEDMQFTRYPAKTEILNKYNIILEEYDLICEELESVLSFGCCGWCV